MSHDNDHGHDDDFHSHDVPSDPALRVQALETVLADKGLVDRAALDQLLLKTADVVELAESGRLQIEGDGEKIGELLGLLEEPDPRFPIVTPRA